MSDKSAGRVQEAPYYAYDYSTEDFVGVLLKLTYIGPQSESGYPGLLIFSYFGRPDLEAFKPYPRAGVHYGNDDLGVLWYVTTALERLRALVLTVKSTKGIDQAAARTGQEAVSHSLSIVEVWSVHRPNAFETLLTLEETAAVVDAAAPGSNIIVSLTPRRTKRNAGRLLNAPTTG